MTETTTAAPANPFIDAARETVTGLINENNNRAERLRNAGNFAATLAEYRDKAETTDPEVLKYRAMFEQAQAEILSWQKAVEEHIKSAGLVDTTDVDVDAETAAWKSQHSTVKSMLTVIEQIGGKDALNNLPEVKGIPGTRSASGSSGATGIKRPRFQSIRYALATTPDNWTEVYTSDEKDGVMVQKTNLTLLAQSLTKTFKDAGASVEASDLQSALYSEAGTQDLSALEGKPVSFGFAVGAGEKAVNLIVEVTPRVK